MPDRSKEFLEKGYKEFKPSPIDGECVTRAFQKRFRDDGGTKYFVTVKEWDFSRYSSRGGFTDPVSYEHQVQLYRAGDHAALDLNFFSDWPIEAVEAETERIYQTGPYERYEDDYENAGATKDGAKRENATSETDWKAMYEQAAWERDVAIEQLRSLGYSLGEKPKEGDSATKKEGSS